MKVRRSSRRIAILVLVAEAVLLLAGCGPTPTTPPPPTHPTPSPTPLSTARPTATPAPTETPPPPTPIPFPAVLRLNLGTEPPTLDPALATDTTSLDVIEQLFLGLTAFDPQTAAVIPELATSWEASDGGAVWTFYLRDDVYWVRYDAAADAVQEIRPVTAHDVVYAIRRAVMPETDSPYAYVLYAVRNAERIHTTDVPSETYTIEDLGVTALDEHTVRFELEAPAYYFPAVAGMAVCRPVPQETIEEHGASWTEPGTIVTNAAYVLEDWAHGSRITLAKNPHYHRADQIQVVAVDLFMIPDPLTALAMYENDELDSTAVPPGDLERMRADPVLSNELVIAPVPCTEYYGFTTTKPPFDDVRVRRAFSYAIDRQRLIEDVLEGGQSPADVLAPPAIFGSPAGDPNGGISYDPERARDELSQAGYPGGEGFPIVTLLYNDGETHAQVAQEIQQMWKEVLGVEVILESVGWEDYLTTISSDAPEEEVPHIWRLGWCAAYPDEHNWVHELLNPTEGINRSRLRLDDPQVGVLVQQFDELTRSAAQEADPVRRAGMYQQAEYLAIHEIAAIASLYYYAHPHMTKPYLQRSYPPLGGLDIENWRMEPH